MAKKAAGRHQMENSGLQLGRSMTLGYGGPSSPMYYTVSGVHCIDGGSALVMVYTVQAVTWLLCGGGRCSVTENLWLRWCLPLTPKASTHNSLIPHVDLPRDDPNPDKVHCNCSTLTLSQVQVWISKNCKVPRLHHCRNFSS